MTIKLKTVQSKSGKWHWYIETGTLNHISEEFDTEDDALLYGIFAMSRLS